jgi:GNAT superfamily N-acetyltransferase
VRRELADGFELDDDPGRIDVDAVHAFISRESYWGRGRPRERVERAIRGSARVVGLYRGAEQIGFARAVSDRATIAYLADVYVLPAFRGRGLGLELVREAVDGGAGRDVRWLLHTADAQALYAKLGFAEDQPTYPLMERGRGYDSSP